MNGFSLTPTQTNTLIDKLYEIIGRKNGVKIVRVKINENKKCA